jgi:type III restriction enzyme
VQAARPIVIEPQSVDATDRVQEGIKALNPFCTLRYSATHRHPYNLVYRLGPVRAFELKLVKQIVVASAVAEDGANDAFVRVEQIDNKKGIKARLRIHMQTAGRPKEKSVPVKHRADLFVLSNERPHYAQGFSVAEINAEPGNEFICFTNGRILRLGEEIGGLRDDIWHTQVKHTIQRHLVKELQVRERGIKVLSLFFIGRVANYHDYDGAGRPIKDMFAATFEAELTALARDKRYRALTWLQEPIDKLHNGYFAQDKKGVLKDTRGDTQADDEVYNLIMKDKERLLALEEPLRFIFSHSALREGWDNPNVFQICTLNETRSVLKKRQEIGRGLRLPVDHHGLRVFDASVNKSARPRGRGISCSCAPARPTKFAAVSSTSQPSACRLPLRSAPTRCDCPRADRTKTRHFYAGTSAARPGAHRGEGWLGAAWPGHVPQDGIG